MYMAQNEIAGVRGLKTLQGITLTDFHFFFTQIAGIVMTHLFIKQIEEQIELWRNPPKYRYRPSQDVNGRSGPFY